MYTIISHIIISCAPLSYSVIIQHTLLFWVKVYMTSALIVTLIIGVAVIAPISQKCSWAFFAQWHNPSVITKGTKEDYIPNRLICRGVSDFVTGYPCKLFYRLCNCPLYVGPRTCKRILDNSWCDVVSNDFQFYAYNIVTRSVDILYCPRFEICFMFTSRIPFELP